MSKNTVDETKTVGILVVHGMGEQLPGDHLNSVAESLVRVWQKKYGRANVTEMRDASRKCDHGLSGDCDKRHPDECVTVLVKCGNGNDASIRIEIREVFWADLDETPRGAGQAIMQQFRFWCWGLSQWSVRRYSAKETELPGSKTMIEPIPDGESNIRLNVRLHLFGVGVAFALLGATMELARFIVRRFRIATVGPGIFVSHLGDVQLYTENRYKYRPTDVMLTDAPRDAIRRRMVSGLLKMALRQYDRWYVIAHSLGTVVAHNGLMELAEALPNYLSSKEWECAKELDRLTTTDDELEERPMRPARPSWLDTTDIIDRSVLFERLKGFCTYGSPLDKFATLWPGIVPINPDPEPLARREWINVYDRMDPVAASLDRFGKRNPFTLENVPYKASILFLLAHIAYLSTVARKFGDVLCHAALASGDWVAGRRWRTLRRSWRVNCHLKGWAMAS